MDWFCLNYWWCNLYSKMILIRSIFAISFILITLSSCNSEFNKPLPTTNLVERNNTLKEIEKQFKILETADPKIAISLTSHIDHRVRVKAAKRLAKHGRKTNEITDTLIKLLKDKNTDVQVNAAIALGAVGNTNAIKPLIHSLADKNRKVRLYASKALRKQEDKAIVTMMLYLEDDSLSKDLYYFDEAKKKHHLSKVLKKQLILMGKFAVPSLSSRLWDNDEKIQLGTAKILGKIGKDAKEALYDLIEVLKSSNNDDLRMQILITLGKIGDLHPEIIPTLMEISKSKSKLSKQADKTLKKIEVLAEPKDIGEKYK